jgi:hypothetical protein
MIQAASTTDNDPLLLPYLNARNEADAEQALTCVLSELVEPVAREIITYKLKVCSDQSLAREVDDVFGDTVVSLLTQLDQLKYENQSSPIKNLQLCRGHGLPGLQCPLRRRYPRRHSLKNKIRYLLDKQPGFASWADRSGDLVAGFSYWETRAFTDDQLRRARELFATVNELPEASAVSLSLSELIQKIFERSGAPLELDSLVSIVAELWQIKDVPATELDAGEAGLAQLVDPRGSQIAALDRRGYLKTLWSEIKQLSPNHCAALLLNLRYEQNESALELFLLTNTASVAEIAAAVGKSDTWLAEVWNDLPLADALIAEHLQVERQQVTNLRRTARLRLSRRMAEAFAGVADAGK